MLRKIVRLGWPTLSLLLIFVIFLFPKINKQDFVSTLVATLVGVFLVFWLNYLFVLASEKESQLKKFNRLLTFLGNELINNQDDINWLNEAITSAIDRDVINDPICTKSISELTNNIHNESYYSLQAAGHFDVLQNEELFSQIVSVYKDIDLLKSMVRFSGAGHQELKADYEKNVEQYRTLSRTCTTIIPRLKETISNIDKELKLLHENH